MSEMREKGTRRRTAARARGQSLPLIGLMLVVLVGMVGLSVDVGNTFQTERRAVAASNAAALVGMNTYIRKTGSTTPLAVYTAIEDTLKSNGVNVAPHGETPENGQLQLQAFFLDDQGRVLPGGEIKPDPDGNLPNNVGFVQVNLQGEVGTYFARVVGRNDLPVNATSYAGTCPPGEGIYPIAVNNRLLDGNRFANRDDDNDGRPDNGWQVLTSGPYQGRTSIKMDVRGNASGNFSWLRWAEREGANGHGAGSAVELAASLTPPGNITAKFEEADWPNANVPNGYPQNPGVLDIGDWIHGNSGFSNSNDVDAMMDLHIREGTKMVLPIFTEVIGNGSNAQYLLGDLGIFVVLSRGGGGDKYIELVYLGPWDRQTSACSYEPPEPPGRLPALVGDVSFRPEYRDQAADRRPIQYVVVLDVSGSMSANFDGRCNAAQDGSRPPADPGYWQCENGPGGAMPQLLGVGPNYHWANVNERRITVAKNAIRSLVESTNMPGNIGYDPSRPDDQMALVWFDAFVERNGDGSSRDGSFRSFSNNPARILQGVRDAGMWNNDPYRTEGGTNGAAGLFRAALALDAAPRRITQNNRTWEYKRVVIFVTDGVSNQFLDPDAGNLNGGQSTTDTFPAGHPCRNEGRLVISVASCQITGDGTTGGGLSIAFSSRDNNVRAGMDRPITQAGQVSRQDLQPKGVEVFAIALSPIPTTGLQDTIATSPSHFFSAASLVPRADGKTNVDTIMEAINTRVEDPRCIARTDLQRGQPEFRDTILPGDFRTPPRSTLAWPNVGEVLIENVENNITYRVPIQADEVTGRLSYRVKEIPPGTYKLTPYLFYRHPLDNTLRMYSNILSGEELLPSITVVVNPEGNSSSGMSPEVRKDLELRLNGDVCTQ